MSDDPDILRTDVAIVGAGLAGLTAARLLLAAGVSSVVLDGQPPGGRARTDRRADFLFNRGPRALYLDASAERVLARVGVRPHGGSPSADAHGLLGDRLGVLPSGAASLARTSLLGWRGKLAVGRLLAGLPKVSTKGLESVSFAAWLDEQRLPSDARALVEMVARIATYANAPELASADMVVGQIQLALGSGVRYLDGGWQTLVDALLAGVELRRASVVAVGRDGGHVVATTAEGAQVVATAAIVATGTPQAAASLLARRPFAVGPPVEAACLDLGTTVAPRPAFLAGVDRPLYLSNHCPPARLAGEGHFVVHVARYLAPDDAAEPGAQRAELAAHAARAGLHGDVIAEQRYLHRMTVAGALATADLGGLRGRPAIDAADVAGVFLAGDWVGPHGHLLDAALASAEAAATAAATLVQR